MKMAKKKDLLNVDMKRNQNEENNHIEFMFTMFI